MPNQQDRAAASGLAMAFASDRSRDSAEQSRKADVLATVKKCCDSLISVSASRQFASLDTDLITGFTEELLSMLEKEQL